MFAIAELTELEERKLLEDVAIEDDEFTEDTDDEREDGATDEGTDDEEGIDEEEGIEDAEDEPGRLLLDKTTCELLPPTIPQGAGCEAQVEREIQLLLFS